MNPVSRAASVAPWSEWVERVMIHVSAYLDFEGQELPGGRQRHVRDLASAIRDVCGLPVVVVQKATRSFETTCAGGHAVVGIKCPTSSLGDPWLGWTSWRMRRRTDGVIYACGDSAWPMFAPRSKGIQHGVWWDGPIAAGMRALQRRRAMDFAAAMDSILCVDTNFVNWLRCQGARGLALTDKCHYVPNYADLEALDDGAADRPLGEPVRLLFARRFEPKRGAVLFLDALAILQRRGFDFSATLLTIGGVSAIEQLMHDRALGSRVQIAEDGMDAVLSRYRESDVAVVPTIWSEGTSLACVEAICAGVPVVATHVGGLGNLIVPEHNGVLVPPSAEALADGIQHVADAARWTRMRRNCLSMRDALSARRWTAQVVDWVRS